MRLRFWRRRPCDCDSPLLVSNVFDDDVLSSVRIVDCSDVDVRVVAAEQHLWPDTVLRHPDLWFDGLWEDPDDWRHDPLLQKVKRDMQALKVRRDMHARVGAQPFFGAEFGRMLEEPFMPRLEKENRGS